MVKNLFERLNKGRPALGATNKLPRNSAKILLDWLVNHWPRETISASEICTYGPYPFRTRDRAVELAETLAKLGWLVALKTPRRNMRKWQIVRGPTPLALFLPTPETTMAPPTGVHETPEAGEKARF
jgi:hypothetical protein